MISQHPSPVSFTSTNKAVNAINLTLVQSRYHSLSIWHCSLSAAPSQRVLHVSSQSCPTKSCNRPPLPQHTRNQYPEFERKKYATDPFVEIYSHRKLLINAEHLYVKNAKRGLDFSFPHIALLLGLNLQPLPKLKAST